MLKYYVVLGVVLVSSIVYLAGGGFGREAACSDVWVAGKTLADDYDGCDEGAAIDPGSRMSTCADGSTLAAYHQLWAKPGQVISDASTPNGRAQLDAALVRCSPNG